MVQGARLLAGQGFRVVRTRIPLIVDDVWALA
jgi:hypothetical protein